MADQPPIEVIKAARLAAVYGEDWNTLSQEERRKYLNCVEAITRAAGGERNG